MYDLCIGICDEHVDRQYVLCRELSWSMLRLFCGLGNGCIRGRRLDVGVVERDVSSVRAHAIFGAIDQFCIRAGAAFVSVYVVRYQSKTVEIVLLIA